MNLKLNLISKNQTIGNSLSTINDNFDQLDKNLKVLYDKTDERINPFMLYLDQVESIWTKAYDIARKNYLLWNSAASCVETNRNKWITPLVLFYPNKISETQNISISVLSNEQIRDQVLTWLKRYWPISPNNPSGPSSLAGQIAIVYCLKYKQTSPINYKNIKQYSATTCSVADVRACAACVSDCWGWVRSCVFMNCGPKTVSCDSNCQTVDCRYTINGGNSKTSSHERFVQSLSNFNFISKYETRLQAIQFSVQNCDWVYDRFLPQAGSEILI